MTTPLLQDDAFLTDVRSAPSGPDVLHLWWLGQSGFLIAWNGRFILLDPYLSDSLTTKYANTDKPHVRMTGRVVAPERLGFIDIVTSSHNHTDHLDADTLVPLIRANPAMRVVVPEANCGFAAQRLGADPLSLLGIDAGMSVDIFGFTITGIPAAHNALERDDRGRYRFLGYVVRMGSFSIYHSGDTLWHDEILAHLKRLPRIDVALLPINGDRPERRVAGNLDGTQAARLAHEIGARLVVPCHYDMFGFNTASPDEFVAECQRLGQAHRVLRNGQRLSL